jgi:hypothetical protein
MADIDIVPKHRSRTWLWIVLAIIVIAIIWFALASGRPANGRVGGDLDAPHPFALMQTVQNG